MAHVGCLDRRSILSVLAPVAQLDRASGFYPLGCGFDSCRGRQVQVRDLPFILLAVSGAPWARRPDTCAPDGDHFGLGDEPSSASAMARSRLSVAC